MSYRGRILTVLVTVFSYLLWHFASLWTFGHHLIGAVYFSAPFQLGLAWWLGKQYDKMKFLSEKDALTGLYNRRFFLQVIPKMMYRIDRHGFKLALSILDFDDFKIINDTYGHQTGDFFLQSISKVLIENTRASDVVCRWGGDEFLVLTSIKDIEDSVEMINRIQSEFRRFSDHTGISFSLSTGTSFYQDDGTTIEQLISSADNRMYKMKSELKQ